MLARDHPPNPRGITKLLERTLLQDMSAISSIKQRNSQTDEGREIRTTSLDRNKYKKLIGTRTILQTNNNKGGINVALGTVKLSKEMVSLPTTETVINHLRHNTRDM